MVDIINYIRNLIFAQPDSRKRRSPLEEYEIPISPKIRRISASQMSNAFEDDWHSISSSNSMKQRNVQHSSTISSKARPSWSKENITVTIDDDDDDVLEISKSKQKQWLDSLKTSRKSMHFTSTPTMASTHRPAFHQNGDEDVTFLKCTQSSVEKMMDAKKRGFDYIKPYSYLNENVAHKGKGVQNGTNTYDVTSPILSSVKEIKAKLGIGRRPTIRSSVLDQSFRLDEKAKYKRLLAQATKSPALQESFSKYSLLPSSKFSSGTANRGKKLVEMAIASSKPLPTIDLTCSDTNGKDKPLSTKDTIKKVLSNFDNDPVVVKDSDSDVEVVAVPPSPKSDFNVERVNTLKKIIDTSEPTHQDWLQQRVQKYKDDVAKYEREIQAQILQRNKLSAVTSEVYAQRLEDQMVKCLKIKDAVLPVRLVEETAFPELSDEDEQRIDAALNKRANPNEVLVQKFNLNITRRDIQTLAGLNWLNDEVINFYMNLIIERGKNPKWPKAYAMNTFFYPKLQKDGPSSLRRWTRRVDIFSYDLIAVPIHLGVHWCMSIIDFRSKIISYYDSMGSTNRQCLEALLNYLLAEHLDKKQLELDASDWALESVQDIPQQMNGSDCGMFSCTFAEFLTRNAKITFSQENMPYLRRKMVLEILNGELLIQ